MLRVTGKPREALADGLEPALAADPWNFWILLNRARAFEDMASCDSGEAAWQNLLARADEKTRDHCPTWIRTTAEASIARSQQDRLSQPRAA